MSKWVCRASWFFVCLSVLAGCSATSPCSADADCSPGQVCNEGKCIAAPAQCAAGDTRPCGPDPVGACRRGAQSCVDGAFETTCTGAITANAEVCNGVDDDCDGTIDEGVTLTFYVDRDGDGFGSNAAGTETAQACTKPTGFSANASDCNDTPGSGFFTNPGATEACDPGLTDENCNGMANEGCGCNSAGATQACCAGRGTQVCEARDGGLTLSPCSVLASLEICNGIDDDCDGLTDEMVAFSTGDGGSDAGTFEVDGGCSVGVGACASAGVASCNSSRLVCSATPGTPGVEICNGVDDDCDGQSDEASATLCAVTGQLCIAATCGCPAGQSVCGASCQAVGGTCSLGLGACARSGVMTCNGGGLVCNATPGQPSTEICNNLDDNCDGMTDEPASTLCAASGQSCTAGSCVCPGSQTVCGTSCQTLGGTCSAGVGACLRPGVIACISGGAACNAVPGSSVAEVCDGVDNDCDGAIDNGVTITCSPDVDNDQYATSAATSQLCPASGRAAFGNCPVGFVAPGSSLGIDCDPTNANAYRLAQTRADADDDTYCAGAAAFQCIGVAVPAGRRLNTACAATDDCNDANTGVFVLASVRADVDGDGHCAGAATNACTGVSAPAGKRFSAQCAAPDDCNDANPAQFATYSVRADADTDGYCSGATVTQCAGASPNPGTRLAGACLGDDCKDDNFFATTVCFVPVGYTTQSHSMSCGIGLPGVTTTFVPIATGCPTSFSISSLRTEKFSGAGTCTALDANTLQQSCTGFDASNCRIVGDCVAN